ncbi:MAG TPA: ATP-binding protein [Methylomirabilota bacterium]|nr:ATP-binding protein [Methylomirabilota bacterium]
MRKILIIDDDVPFREVLSASLSKHGFQTVQAGDGAEGVRIARIERPHLILCDINMSGVDGYLTLHAFRHDPLLGSIPFLLMTGKPDPDGLRHGMELGADDYLAKPFRIEALLTAIEARFARHRNIRSEVERRLAELRGSISTALPEELLGPVNVIVEMTEFISTGYRHLEEGEILGLARDVHTSALRLQRMIQNCLLYASLEVLASDAEKLEAIRRQRSHARDVVEPAVIDQSKKARRQADLRLERTLTNTELAIAPEHLEKIIGEVLDNAFKFSSPGTPVRVETTIQGEDFRCVVSDQGRGMTAQQISDIGAYQQFERKLHEQRGSGLGLFLARRLTELHNGTFQIERNSGAGTTVSITLPRILP